MPRLCLNCEKDMGSKRPQSKFCSDKCRNRHKSRVAYNKAKEFGLCSRCRTREKEIDSAMCSLCKSKVRVHPSRTRSQSNLHRLRKYGLSSEDIDVLMKKQNNSCKICLKSIPPFHIDRDHKTGKVRGLLCQQCNHGLGMFKDSVDNLLRAISYLDSTDGL